jgi:catechol 2,3-dioxygenase-like lactoylglutathione lyase family enzyme
VSETARELTSHFALTTSDLDRSIRFYVDHLGFAQPNETHTMDRPWFEEGLGRPGAIGRVAFIRRGGILLELFAFQKSSGNVDVPDPTFVGATHIGMQVEDLDEVYERLTAAGVEFVSPPVEVDQGEFAGARWCYLKDPDGFLVEVYWLPGGQTIDDI